MTPSLWLLHHFLDFNYLLLSVIFCAIKINDLKYGKHTLKYKKKLWLVYTANFYRKTYFKELSVIIIGIAFKKNCGISLVYIIIIIVSSSSINESSWRDRVIL